MKAIKVAIVMILVLNAAVSLMNWMSKDEEAAPLQTYQQAQLPDAAEVSAAGGLDLRALTDLVKEVRSGQELERRLNEPGSINNLDLNGDNKVDYIFVSEFGDVQHKIGYSLTVQPEKDETQEVATVTVEKNGDRAEIQVVGNEQIYGDQAIYNDATTIQRDPQEVAQTDTKAAPVYNNYFYPRPLWISPWYFGFYPPYFSFFPIVRHSTYVTRVNRYHSPTTQRGYSRYQRSSSRQIRNPNRGKTASRGIARSLSKPTATQKQFQVTRNRNLRSGGFGRSNSSRSPASSRQSSSKSILGRSSSGVRSTRSRSFNSLFSRSRSSSFRSGSFRSGSFGSRSFSFGK